MSTVPPNPESPQFPPTALCATCGRPTSAPPGSPPPELPPGSRFAAAMAEYLILRREYQEADRQLGESFEQLESTAPAAGSVR